MVGGTGGWGGGPYQYLSGAINLGGGYQYVSGATNWGGGHIITYQGLPIRGGISVLIRG